jgi:NitT/TauT family transport system permease protein
MKKLFGKIGNAIRNVDPSMHIPAFVFLFLLLAYFLHKAGPGRVVDVFIWPSFLFPKSFFLSAVSELIYAYYFIRLIRFLLRKLSLLVRIVKGKDSEKNLDPSLESKPKNIRELSKSIGRWMLSLPGKALNKFISLGRRIARIPMKTWQGIKSFGRWIAGLPQKTWETISRLPRSAARELFGLGKEFMELIKNFYRLRTVPGKRISLLLSLILFLVCIKLYYNTSVERHAENPQDKLVPTAEQLWNGFKKTLFDVKNKEEYDDKGDIIKNDLPVTFREARARDKQALAAGKFRNRWEMWKNGSAREYLKQGQSLLWQDTQASGRRILISMVFIFAGIYVGLFIGAFPYAEKFLYRFVLFFDKVPALAILPILFIIFGLGETAKIALIVIGVAPTVILDTYLKVKEVQDEQLVKGMTLGASQPEIIFKIIFPQIIPKVLDTVRLNFKAIILFLIAGEALAAEAGIGYRIFVVRRYMDMATIFPYVVWISLLAFFVDMGFRTWISRHYQWLNK